MSTKAKALVLLSGGLDSILATKLLLKLDIRVRAITFVTPFWSVEKPKEAAQKLGVTLKISDISKKHLKMLKAPRYGYGSNMNPCIDCHTLMVSEAWSYAKKNGYDFLATGEVLGERPMSQNKGSLKKVAKNSGADGFLVRPLSAKLLEETVPESKGLIDRRKLLAISGRSRKPQLALAKKWGIEYFPAPSGGCLLTDPGYSKRLRELYKKIPSFTSEDANILKFGRVFWIENNLVIVGRDEKDNENIEKVASKKDVLMRIKDITGPVSLVRSFGKSISRTTLVRAGQLTLKYKKMKEGTLSYGRGHAFNKEISI